MAILLYGDPNTGETLTSHEIRIRFLSTSPNESDTSGSSLVIQFEATDKPMQTALMVGLDELFGYMQQLIDADQTAAAAYEMEREARKDGKRARPALELMKTTLSQMTDLSQQVHTLAEAYDREIPKLEAWIANEDETNAVPPYMKRSDEDA